MQTIGDDDDESEHVWRHGEELCDITFKAQRGDTFDLVSCTVVDSERLYRLERIVMKIWPLPNKNKVLSTGLSMVFGKGLRHTATLLVNVPRNQREDCLDTYHCRREVRETVETVDHEEVRGRVHPERWVEKRLFRYLEVKGLVFLVRRKGSHASDSEDAFLFSKKIGGLRIIRHPDPDNATEQNGRNSSQDKQPLPAGEVCFAVEERNAVDLKSMERFMRRFMTL